MKCCLEACHSTGWNGHDLTTVWASQRELSLLVSNNQPDQALLAVDTNGAVELIKYSHCQFVYVALLFWGGCVGLMVTTIVTSHQI